MLLSDRKRLILKAVIEYYSKDSKPVGSQLLAKLSYLKFSSATIRYDMLQLEKKGYLEKVHKSSGRIPSIKGYVFYLNNLITRKQENEKLFILFEKIIKQNKNLKEKIIKDLFNSFCDFTNYVVINVKSDFLKHHKINELKLIFVNEEKAVLLVITEKGYLRNQNIFLEKNKDFDIQDLHTIIRIFNNLLFGKHLHEAISILKNDYIIQEKLKISDQYKNYLIQSLIEVFCSFEKYNYDIYGITNFWNFIDNKNFQEIKKMMNLLDTKELNEIFFNSPQKIICQLVNQIRLMSYYNLIIISIPYYINEREKGFIAVLGPRIIKYQEIIPFLEYLSAHLSNLYIE
ncbi:heat-inducible transcriptional repressor HrcA [Candidatus Phytoplasma pini]|uniref:heat-inducible transcriptional repressor HrcA n=1 Tax=Candidatus Phytoplasma pini TaxID=267362 RepID=UPI001FEC2B8D|nr:heat-inducible transcriptional repressor HrcA [Candidatus Phytoplasma pini]